MMLFRNRPQSERSAIIRVMWEAERHKTSWALMARVWTFIRDQTEYNNIVAFLACAIDLIRTVPPDVWLATYKMVLVKDREGKVTLRQYGQPEHIRAPRDLSDFELLKGVVLRGLSVDDAEGLLRKMLQRSNHMMTVTTMDAEVITDVTDVTDDPDKADESFVNSVNQDPVMTFVELLGLPVTDNVFNFGVNVIDTNDVTNFNDTLVTTTGAHTHMRYQFDTSTVHLTRPEADSLDMNTQETNIAFDLGLPEQWQNHDGQISQGDYSACRCHPAPYPVNMLTETFSYWYHSKRCASLPHGGGLLQLPPRL